MLAVRTNENLWNVANNQSAVWVVVFDVNLFENLVVNMSLINVSLMSQIACSVSKIIKLLNF